ncbi:MAG: hypothetical protein ACOYXW_03500 [Actinomycetota bacterium]
MTQTSPGGTRGRVTGPASVLRRLDAALARGAAVNAARAVATEKARRRRWALENDAVMLLPQQQARH